MDGRDANGSGEMGFAGAGAAQEDEVVGDAPAWVFQFAARSRRWSYL